MKDFCFEVGVVGVFLPRVDLRRGDFAVPYLEGGFLLFFLLSYLDGERVGDLFLEVGVRGVLGVLGVVGVLGVLRIPVRASAPFRLLFPVLPLVGVFSDFEGDLAGVASSFIGTCVMCSPGLPIVNFT